MAKYEDTLILKDKVSGTMQKIVLNFGRVNKKLENINKKTEKLEKNFKNIKKVGNSVSDFGGKITRSTAVLAASLAAVGAGMIAAMNKAADYGDKIDKMSQKIGMSREKYQELNFVLSQNGMDVDQLQMAYKTLTNQMASAQKGSKDSLNTFRQLGVQIRNCNGQMRSADDVFDDALKKLMQMKNPTQRMAHAIKLFGRNAQELAPLLNSGLISYEQLKKAVRDKGMILSDEEIKNAVVYKDTMDKFSKMWDARLTSVAIKHMPKITEYLDKIMSNDKAIGNMVNLVAQGLEMIVKMFGFIDKHKTVSLIIGGIVAVIGPLLTALGVLSMSIIAINTALGLLAANPVVLTIIAITAAIAAVGVAIFLLWKNWDKVWSAITTLTLNTIKNITNWLDELIQKLGWIAYLIPGLNSYAVGKNIAGGISSNINKSDNSIRTTNNNQTYNYGNTFNLSGSFKAGSDLGSLLDARRNMPYLANP